MEQTAKHIDPALWLEQYGDAFFRFAYGKTGNTDLAEDLVQETFLAGLKSISTFKNQSSEKTWLYAILKNKIAEHYRKASTRNEIRAFEKEASDDYFFAEDGHWNANAAPRDLGIDFSQAIENKELAAILNACIEKLSGLHQQLVLLKLIEELETEFVCKELCLTASNYWVIIHRAKLQLRACIEKNWLNE